MTASCGYKSARQPSNDSNTETAQKVDFCRGAHNSCVYSPSAVATAPKPAPTANSRGLRWYHRVQNRPGMAAAPQVNTAANPRIIQMLSHQTGCVGSAKYPLRRAIVPITNGTRTIKCTSSQLNEVCARS